MYWSTQSYVWICLEKLMYCKSATLVKLSFPGFLYQRKKRKHRTVRLNMWLEFSNCRHWWRFELCFKKSNITCHSMHSHTAASSQWSLPLLDLLLCNMYISETLLRNGKENHPRNRFRHWKSCKEKHTIWKMAEANEFQIPRVKLGNQGLEVNPMPFLEYLFKFFLKETSTLNVFKSHFFENPSA